VAQRREEGQVHRFIWQSSFDGDAVVRVGRQRDVVTLRWRRHRRFGSPSADDSPAQFAIALEDWARLTHALSAADFWSLDPVERGLGLDGAQWLFDRGRRENGCHGISRWSPQGGLYALGRLFLRWPNRPYRADMVPT
jgi:hypothetical protein